MRYQLFAILDLVAQELVGGHGAIHIFAHTAQAVRFFDDIASNAKSTLAARPQDYALVYLGDLLSNPSPDKPEDFRTDLKADYHIVLLGNVWAASKQGQPELVKES